MREQKEKLLKAADEALTKLDAARGDVKQAELAVRELCRAYGELNRLWGMSETHLRRAVKGEL